MNALIVALIVGLMISNSFSQPLDQSGCPAELNHLPGYEMDCPWTGNTTWRSISDDSAQCLLDTCAKNLTNDADTALKTCQRINPAAGLSPSFHSQADWYAYLEAMSFIRSWWVTDYLVQPPVWISLWKPVGQDWQWRDGTLVNYTAWARREPRADLPADQDLCAVKIKGAGFQGMYWRAVRCAEEQYYVCSVPKVVID